MRLIEASHLTTWAASIPSQNRFPYIVKLLICAVIEPDKLQMPSGDTIWLPGYDGVLINSQQNRFVPTGFSVWELGTDKDIKRKADKDYRKRSQDVDQATNGEEQCAPQSDRSQHIFVFVTPRVWAKKNTWIAERKQEGIWRDVIVIDGADLQDWLEAAPAVNLQFAAELGLAPESGLQPPELAWDEWRHLATPPISEELVITGREEQANELIQHLLTPPDILTVRGDSPREAWGFTLAALRRIDSEEERLRLTARVIIAKDVEVAHQLTNHKNLIIILKQAKTQISNLFVRRGCHVVVPEGNDAHTERNVISLPRRSHRPFATALVKMGLGEDTAERATRACGLSVTVLMRQRASANIEVPFWARSENVAPLLPALLAGRWSERNEADRTLLCHLANVTDYGDVERDLQRFRNMDEAPLQKLDDVWILTAPADAFQLISRYLTSSDLKRFKDAFRMVFGQIDPKVEHSLDEWIYLEIKESRNQEHSTWLRTGMAETLLLIAERGKDAQLNCVQSTSAYAIEVVRGLPGLSDDWRVLASLRDQFPRLMEAAPRPLLDGLKQMLEAHPDDLRRLFAEGGTFAGAPMHTGLLWGLEILAWRPEHFAEVCDLLAQLASIDPGGKWSNRPLNSLREIFLWWHLGTNATLDQRLAILDSVLIRQPEIGWKLLASLLPQSFPSISHPTMKPRWQDAGDYPEDTYTIKGKSRYVSAIVERALNNAGTRPERWKVILDSFPALSHREQITAIVLLETLGKSSADQSVRVAMWEVLRDFIAEHRTFAVAKWALPDATLTRLEAILPIFAPNDLLRQYRWLFDEWLPRLPTGMGNVEVRDLEVRNLREQAIRHIIQEMGLAGLVNLGIQCAYPGTVALSAVPLLGNVEAVLSFIEQVLAVDEGQLTFVGQISARAKESYGEAWQEVVRQHAVSKKWSPVVVTSLLVWWPDTEATWKDVESLGVSNEYWRMKPLFLIDGTAEEQTYQIDHLIEAKRATQVFKSVALHGEEVPTEVLTHLFDAAFDELAQIQTSEEIQRLGLNSYDIQRILSMLYSRTDMPREALAIREYRALSLLMSPEVGNLAIHDFLMEDPAFFVEILCDVFRPAHRDTAHEPDITPQTQARAQAGYRLLSGMNKIPGQREENQIDQEVLLRWITAVQEKARETDRAEIGDEKIGEILAHALNDPQDNSWPHRVVRNVIEELASEHIERGLMVERANMRGVYTKALYEGGVQERELAAQYQKWAATSRTAWPKMARVLETMAQGWLEQAEREDARAEQMKLE